MLVTESTNKVRLSRTELLSRDRAYVKAICEDEQYAYLFLHEKCRPLITKIAWTMYGSKTDYDELVNTLYVHLRKPDRNGIYWANLRTFDYRTSLFDWIKTVAIRLFYVPSLDTFSFPSTVIDSGLAEEMIRSIPNLKSRDFLLNFYIMRYDKLKTCESVDIPSSEYASFSRKAIKTLEVCIRNNYPEYYDFIFSHQKNIELPIDASITVEDETDHFSSIESRHDIFKFISQMPNEKYKKILISLYIKDMTPEELAQELNVTIDNIYNLKVRSLDQARDVVLYSGEITQLDSYIKLIVDDRKRQILHSIFVEKKSYDAISSELGISYAEFKRMKQSALKELKRIIF